MDWNETITSFIGVSPIILKAGNAELMKSLQAPLSFTDYPLLGEFNHILETKNTKTEAKHERMIDIVAHQLYATSLHNFVINSGVKIIVELGILEGVSSSAFLRAMSWRKEGHLWSFDPNTTNIKWWWMPPEWQTYWNYYSMMGEAGYRSYGESVGEIDAVYIDTAHTYDDTVNFLNNYWIHNVREGGYILVDDCTPNFQAEVDRAKIPDGYWADAQGYGILRPVMEFIEQRNDDIEFAYIMNAVYSSGVCVIKLKD
jgi:predicted O-methyltransferase YrrM